ncbi:MAG: hypothetical protein KF757_07440 [Phycisphaeraceae bacterium]|nr:hypothetical protein [Phycisphaeraceae bacterium]MCW5764318.1 hypothetical protein [Phycisphaeraceae bacterium]
MRLYDNELPLFDRREAAAERSPEREDKALETPKERHPPLAWESTEGLSRSAIVEQILEINITASLEFLSEFSDQDLSNYLNHLLWLQQPRTGQARWIRPGDSPAVMARSRDY